MNPYSVNKGRDAFFLRRFFRKAKAPGTELASMEDMHDDAPNILAEAPISPGVNKFAVKEMHEAKETKETKDPGPITINVEIKENPKDNVVPAVPVVPSVPSVPTPVPIPVPVPTSTTPESVMPVMPRKVCSVIEELLVPEIREISKYAIADEDLPEIEASPEVPEPEVLPSDVKESSIHNDNNEEVKDVTEEKVVEEKEIDKVEEKEEETVEEKEVEQVVENKVDDLSIIYQADDGALYAQKSLDATETAIVDKIITEPVVSSNEPSPEVLASFLDTPSTSKKSSNTKQKSSNTKKTSSKKKK